MSSSTKTVATRLPPEIIARLELVAQIDRRSVAQVIALLIERGLPDWEEEIDARRHGYPPAPTANAAAIRNGVADSVSAMRNPPAHASSSPKAEVSPRRVAEDIVQQTISQVSAASPRRSKRGSQ